MALRVLGQVVGSRHLFILRIGSAMARRVVVIVTALMRQTLAFVTALMLSLAIASPAIAEIGCSWDAATHFSETADHADEHKADAPDPGGSDSGNDADRDSHCAFSHGHGALATRGDNPASPPRILTFASPIAAIFVSSLPPGLDRPPRG